MSLTSEQKSQIAAAVAAAERRTAAEFAVVITPASDDYAGFPLVWSGAIALVAGGLTTLLWPTMSVLDLCLVQGATYALTAVLLSLLPVRARLAPPYVRRTRAEALADLQFTARVAERTRDGVGLLLFVSLAEHTAIIRVDHRIAAALPPSTWQTIIDDMVQGARAGRLAEAIIAAIDACATTLAPAFPPKSNQINEIADRVTTL